MPEESSGNRKRLFSSPWLVAAAVFVVAFLLLLPFSAPSESMVVAWPWRF
jgi:hypothetical protein